jgi:hypothetical protein
MSTQPVLKCTECGQEFPSECPKETCDCGGKLAPAPIKRIAVVSGGGIGALMVKRMIESYEKGLGR